MRRLTEPLHLAAGQREGRTVHDRLVADVEVVEPGRAVDREPRLAGADDPDRPTPALGVGAKGAEGLGPLGLGPDGVGRDERDAAVDGVGDQGVAEEVELLVVAQREVVERAAAVATHDLSRPEFGEASLGPAARHRETPVHDGSCQQVERRDEQRDTDGEKRGIHEVGRGVGQGDVVEADETLDAGHEDHAEGGQVMTTRGDLDADRGRHDRDERDEAEARHRGAHARAVRRRLEVASLHHQQGQDRDRDQRGDEGATAQHVGDDGDREHHAGHEPRAALSAADAPGHHDHGDTGDGGERGGGLGHAEGEDRLDRVETAAQGRRRRDDHVDQAVEEEQAARPATHGALTPLLLESLDGHGEGMARGPRTDRRGGRRWWGLRVGVGDDLFEEPLLGTSGLAGVEPNLDRARRFDLDHAETVDRAEDRREPEATPSFHDDGSRRPGRGTHALVEEGQGRTRGAADDRPGTEPLGVAAREFEGVDVVDQREGQRLAQFGRRGPTRVAVEAAPHDEAGARDDDGLDHGQDEEVEHEVAPETAGVGRVHVDAVSREVVVDRVERRQDVEHQQGDGREPDPTAESPVEHPRGDEARQRVRVLESVGVGTVVEVRALGVDGAVARRDREVAHPVGRGDVEDQVAGQRDAQALETFAGLSIVLQLVVVAPGQDDEAVSFVGGEGDDLVAQGRQRPQRRVDESDEVRGGLGVEEVAGDDHDGGVVDVAQEADELAHRAAVLVGGGRE